MLPFTPEPCLANYALSEFLEVRLVLLRRVCGFLFFLYYLQALDHLEGEAHHAVLLAQVLYATFLVPTNTTDEELRVDEPKPSNCNVR